MHCKSQVADLRFVYDLCAVVSHCIVLWKPTYHTRPRELAVLFLVRLDFVLQVGETMKEFANTE